MSSSELKRLNKYISESGYCSRREADALIEAGKVTINGAIPELGTKVAAGDIVAVKGKVIGASASDKSDRIYIAYNKPVGITCTTERHVSGNIIDAIRHPKRIFPIGRLDKPSEGLILLTSDGDIVNKILRAENAHDKEYVVKVDKPVSPRFAERMQRGVPILGTVTKPCKVVLTGRFEFRIVLTQGLNRQIRRMCEFLGYEVTALSRVRIMHLNLKGLRPGQWRELTSDEMNTLNSAVAGSRKTAQDVDNSSQAEASELSQKVPENKVKPTPPRANPWGESIADKAPEKKQTRRPQQSSQRQEERPNPSKAAENPWQAGDDKSRTKEYRPSANVKRYTATSANGKPKSKRKAGGNTLGLQKK